MSVHKGFITGEHFLMGDHAAAEAAILAGCRFFAGYPITPATEIAERMSTRLPARNAGLTQDSGLVPQGERVPTLAWLARE